jgi:lipopolysaccharide biosynthesis glycosyltransferase
MIKNVKKCAKFVVEFLLFAILIFTFAQISAEPESPEMHIFFCADNGNIIPTCVTMASVLEYASEDEQVHFHIVGNGMDEENIAKLESMKDIYDNFDYDITPFNMDRLSEFDCEGWNKSILIKLFGAELFPKINKILWLDSDVLACEDLTELYNRNLTGKYIAAVDVHDIYNKYDTGDPRKCEYTPYWITAGIGLYNLDEIRKDDMEDKFLDKARIYSIEHDNYKNLCGGIEEWVLSQSIPPEKALLLPYKYSMMAFFSVNEAYHPGYIAEYKNDILDCRIVHFAGMGKPWMSTTDDPDIYRLQRRWWIYAKKIGLLEDAKQKYLQRVTPEQKEKLSQMIESL